MITFGLAHDVGDHLFVKNGVMLHTYGVTLHTSKVGLTMETTGLTSNCVSHQSFIYLLIKRFL